MRHVTTLLIRSGSGARSPGAGPSRSSPGFNAPASAGGATPPSGVSTLARQNAPRGGDYDDRTLLISRGGEGVNGARRGVRNEGYAQVRRQGRQLGGGDHGRISSGIKKGSNNKDTKLWGRGGGVVLS
jgi:hypothetical protein